MGVFFKDIWIPHYADLFPHLLKTRRKTSSAHSGVAANGLTSSGARRSCRPGDREEKHPQLVNSAI